ncbi:MAG: hypothetical protein ACYS47_19975 [Planctomycetota bacterium]|jgi:hypothetical protein
MKYAILFSVLLALLFPGLILAQEAEEDEGGEMEEMEMQIFLKRHELELKKKELELVAYQKELEHQQALREQELEDRRAEREREREDREAEREMHKRHREDRDDHGGPGGIIALFFIICFVVNILAAVWVYLDIRKRNAGSGIWIVVTLLSGLFGALIYGIIRLGDTRAENAGKAAKK